LREFEKRVLRGGWRTLHNEELHTVPKIVRVIKSRRMIWEGRVAHIREMRNADKILIGKPEAKRSCGRPRHRWKDNMRVDLRGTGWKCVDWIHLAE